MLKSTYQYYSIIIVSNAIIIEENLKGLLIQFECIFIANNIIYYRPYLQNLIVYLPFALKKKL